MAGQFSGLDEPAGAEEERASLQELGSYVPSNSPPAGVVFSDKRTRDAHGSPSLPTRFTSRSLLMLRDVLKDLAERDALQRQQDTQTAVPNAPDDSSVTLTVEPR